MIQNASMMQATLFQYHNVYNIGATHRQERATEGKSDGRKEQRNGRKERPKERATPGKSDGGKERRQEKRMIETLKSEW